MNKDAVPNTVPVETVALSSIVRSPEFQPRKSTRPGTVREYAAAMKAGEDFPPIKVAVVDGAAVLVDGFHRVAAMESIGVTETLAEIHRATKAEAAWMAAKANLKHGLPLKPAEKRRAFRLYIKAGQYKNARGRPKSLREIGKELGRSHNTIRAWLLKDFPGTFSRHYSDEAASRPTGGLRESVEFTPLDHARKALEQAVAASRGVHGEENRGALIAAFETALEEIKKAEPWRPLPDPLGIGPSDF